MPSIHYSNIDKDHFDRLCSLLGKRYRLEYMAHFDDFCKQLQRDQEYPTDSLLVSLVGIRKISMKVNNSFWEMIGNPNNQPSGGVYSIAVASIQNELDMFMDQLPANLKWNRMYFLLWKRQVLRLTAQTRSSANALCFDSYSLVRTVQIRRQNRNARTYTSESSNNLGLFAEHTRTIRRISFGTSRIISITHCHINPAHCSRYHQSLTSAVRRGPGVGPEYRTDNV